MNRIILLKALLVLGAIYYFIGGIAHYFGLTIFPWFVRSLYTPYQDSVIALVCLILILILLAVARDPVKNIDILNVIIISIFLSSVFSIAIVWKVNFSALGAPAKKIQTIVEGVIGFVYFFALLWLYPKKSKI